MSIRTSLFCALSLAISPAIHALSFCDRNEYTNACQPDLTPSGDLKCPVDSGLMAVKRFASAPVCVLEVNAPVAVMSECYPAPGGMVCEGWGQEVSVPQRYLNYGWSVRVGTQVTQYQTGTFPYVNFSCNTGQSIAVTMTVTNGTYAASTQQSYTCGDEIE